ncbi:glyco_like_cofC transferase, GTA_type superfamily [Psychroflexus torquis ATCC 700755]|uniref:Glyco_like_cofC transferase, GTA_type superfamily n=1 Tax=Psychroflexus torquis (strain ATCC 700755 / CIP 106069 / ACAM 623) TaxID=313595 RepID=K4IEW1_PSYTT|nr:DUF2064 domain-containing protein [Psychroflexus torquis]AFU68949.1 glyco_like_cofC transferase, GTA_type superfamily [Psychroflexus torquis ATCC 700755]
MITKTAILIFANSARIDAERKCIKNGKEFFDFQHKNLLKLVKESKLPHFWIDENRQVGDDFENRYLNAIQHIFDKGYQQVISIGNDTPGLEVKHILEASELLEYNSMCFGPSRDGGFYLWGVKKDSFEKKSFLNFKWNTKDLLPEILSKLTCNSVQFDCIETLIDLDCNEDAFLLLRNKYIDFQLKCILLKIVRKSKNPSTLFQYIAKTQLKSLYYNKGSPLPA